MPRHDAQRNVLQRGQNHDARQARGASAQSQKGSRRSAKKAKRARRIYLGNGGFTLVDAEDFERFGKMKWSRGDQGYAVRAFWLGVNKWKTFLLHRLIARTPKGRFTDHKNGNRLDNRKRNLRTCSQAQNNCGKFKVYGHSKFKGAYYVKSVNMWQSKIGVEGLDIYLGLFRTEEEAAFAYDVASELAHGEFGCTNAKLGLL